MSRVRDLASILTASSSMATDTEVSAVSAQIPANVAGKNFVINGGMDIWQRGTSFAVSGLGYAAYTVDRWHCYAGGSGTISQDTSLFAPGSRYGLRFTATASGGQNWYQMIETANVAALAGQTVTLSGYAGGTSGVTGNYVLLWYSTNTDAGLFDAGWTACTTVATTLNPAINGTMQRYASVYSVPSNAKSLRVQWTTGALTNTQFQTISGFQLELGSVATPFSRAGGDIQGELAKCQRYYWRSGFPNESIDYAKHALGYSQNTTSLWCQMLYPVTMRVAPSIESSTLAVSGSTIGIYDSISNFNVSSLSIDRSTIRSCNFNANTTGLTAYRPAQLQNLNNINGFIGFSAEL
jgi:hypothetical protein